jgi:hypothetical protein
VAGTGWMNLPAPRGGPCELAVEPLRRWQTDTPKTKSINHVHRSAWLGSACLIPGWRAHINDLGTLPLCDPNLPMASIRLPAASCPSRRPGVRLNGAGASWKPLTCAHRQTVASDLITRSTSGPPQNEQSKIADALGAVGSSSLLTF